MQHRTITPYYNSIINKTVNFCGFLNGTDQNVLAKWIIDSIAETLPFGLLHPCPYFGEIRIFNLSVINDLVAQFLKGHYRVKLRLFDDEDDNILTATHDIDIL